MKEETRECIVKARLTANEYQTFLKKVKGSDRPDNMSEYIRACIFSDDLKHSIAVARELKNMNYQIRKIGVLIFRGDAELVLKKMQEVEELVKTFEARIE